MAPPGLNPEEGSQRFISFLVGLLVFRFRAVTFKPKGCMFLVQNGCVNVCVCTYSPTSTGSVFLFSFCFQFYLRPRFHLLVVAEDLRHSAGTKANWAKSMGTKGHTHASIPSPRFTSACAMLTYPLTIRRDYL